MLCFDTSKTANFRIFSIIPIIKQSYKTQPVQKIGPCLVLIRHGPVRYWFRWKCSFCFSHFLKHEKVEIKFSLNLEKNCKFILLTTCSSTALCIFHDISQWVTITFYSLPKKVLKPFPQFSTNCFLLFSSHICRIQIITSALKVSKFQKHIFLVSFEPKEERNYFLISLDP